jgi:tRNA (guanine-N(7)-)-methyltransferase subunit TRM82
MPKKADAEHDPMRRNELDALEAATHSFENSSRAGTPNAGEPSVKTRELTQREAARLKRKQALSTKIQKDQAQGVTASPSVEPEEGRETKKPKSDAPAGDVAMSETA